MSELKTFPGHSFSRLHVTYQPECDSIDMEHEDGWLHEMTPEEALELAHSLIALAVASECDGNHGEALEEPK